MSQILQYTYYQIIKKSTKDNFQKVTKSGEVKSARGRADAVVKTSDTIYVFEFKMDTNGTAEEALKQIDEKDYLIPYTADGRKIVKVGAEFSAEERRLSRWMAT
ncbi:hypothetical protein FACS189437_01860 [Bacteroidia bacterium]|nr:hypothetical protein FACS189437_01860 [Bacteroidia bacterium]